MISLSNNCFCSVLSVYLKNWQSKNAKVSINWYINYRFYDPNCILVVSHSGRISIILTPFTALCVGKVRNLPMNSWVHVEGVYTTDKQKLIYRINGRYYFHYHFEIVLPFKEINISSKARLINVSQTAADNST